MASTRRHRAPMSEDERQERREQDRRTADAAIAELRSSTGWQAWLAARARFRSYSLTNQCLIAMQHPTATRVAGFRAWLALGYCVRRGEHAIRIWVPMTPSKKALAAWQTAGADPTERPRTMFRLGPVFAQDQVQPLPPPAEPAPLAPPGGPPPPNQAAWALDPLAELTTEIGFTYRTEELADGLCGYCAAKTKRIVIGSGQSENAQVATFVHELAHALVRVDRQDDDPRLTYAEEELVVESVAYTVCAGAIGLDTSSESIPYLAGWAEDAELETIHSTAKLIDRLARRIELALEGTSDGDGESHGAAGVTRVTVDEVAAPSAY